MVLPSFLLLLVILNFFCSSCCFLSPFISVLLVVVAVLFGEALSPFRFDSDDMALLDGGDDDDDDDTTVGSTSLSSLEPLSLLFWRSQCSPCSVAVMIPAGDRVSVPTNTVGGAAVDLFGLYHVRVHD